MNKQDIKIAGTILAELPELMRHAPIINAVLTTHLKEHKSRVVEVEKGLKKKLRKYGESEVERMEKTIIDAKIMIESVEKAHKALNDFKDNILKIMK